MTESESGKYPDTPVMRTSSPGGGCESRCPDVSLSSAIVVGAILNEDLKCKEEVF